MNKIVRSVLAVLFVVPLSCRGIGDYDSGFKPLFNGRNLAGWTVKCKPQDRDTQLWKVDGGTILADSLNHEDHDYVWLVSDGEYSDFVLRLRFQAYRDSPGNSGVQVRSRYDDDAGWLDGPQFDINPPGPWRTAMVWDETRGERGWLWPSVPEGEWVDKSMAAPGFKFYFATDEPSWNKMEITALGTKFKCVLNGVTVCEFDAKGEIDDAVHRARNVGMTGHIALQIHQASRLKIRFKDICIKQLSAGAG